MLYRNEFIFTDSPCFTQRWAFRTEKDFHDQKAFLTFHVGHIAAEQFDFGKQSGKITDGKSRIAQTKGADLPDAIRFPGVLALENLSVPNETGCHLFLQGHSLFLTLLDSSPSSMKSDRWYEFSVNWKTGEK